MNAGKPLGLVVAAGLALGVAAAPAGADPKGDTFALECDDGQTYNVVANGNGNFTPAHDSASTTVFIPLAFGDFTGTITDSQGNVEQLPPDPGIAKGKSGKNAKNTMDCTFSFSETFTDEQGETFTFNGSGSVTGYATPRGGA